MLRSKFRDLVLIKKFGSSEEQRIKVRGHVQNDKGYFEVRTQIYEGDVVEVPDPRGGTRHLTVSRVKIHDYGTNLDHIEVIWGATPSLREAPIRRVTIDGLHPDIVAVSGALFTDGHYATAIFEAFKAIEVRVRRQSGIDTTGRDLMARAFGGDPPPIAVSSAAGRSGQDEQEGLKLIYMGAIQGIRNPKGHELVQQTDPQRTLEYLAFASLLMRRLDDAVSQT